MEEEPRYRVAVLVGTNRPGAYTAKAARLVVDQLGTHPGVGVDLIDLAEMELAFPGHPPTPDKDRLRQTLEGALGVVLATPEYHGGMAAALKLAIENMGFPSGLTGKPVALLGVAAGVIGAIKSIEQVRSIAAHVGALVLPGSVSVARVQKVFDEEGNCLDEKIEKRVRGLADDLVAYLERHVCPLQGTEEQVREDG